MNKIEKLTKEYSSKKLQEIVEQQSKSYSENFIDYAKDELIRRGESFPFNTETEKEVSAMSDNDLKNLVEKEWNNFHLEYLEIARKEYLKRKFKNETNDETQDEEQIGTGGKKYPALRTIAGIYSVFAWIIGIVAVIIAIYFYSQNQTMGLTIGIPSLVVGALLVLGLLAVSESIKVFIDIEENTRKTNE
jgi:hypothetical protein